MIVVTGNGDLPLATQRRVESIASDRSPFAGRKSVRIASLFSLFSFAIFFDSTKRIFPDSGVPFTGFDCWLCYFRYSRGGALDRARSWPPHSGRCFRRSSCAENGGHTRASF